MTQKSVNDISAYDALKTAQIYALAPFIFQLVNAMKKSGVLAALCGLLKDQSVTKDELAAITGMSPYSVSVMMDCAESADLVIRSGKVYAPTKIARYLCDDPMSNVNFAFSSEVCYGGLSKLHESFVSGKPEGLKEFSQTEETIYPILKDLPKSAKDAWFGFDHFYSDRTFSHLLKKIFAAENKPKHICDIGGNTGKFARAAASFDKHVLVTIVDLPAQCETAELLCRETEAADRIRYCPADILNADTALPNDCDFWLMSQFLDCFDEQKISSILQKVRTSMPDGAVLAIYETFADRQRNDIASMVVDLTSLYFTAFANGYSRMYRYDDFMRIVDNSGFKVDSCEDFIGMGHTLLLVRKS